MAVVLRKARPGDAAAVRVLLLALGYDDLPPREYAQTFSLVVAHPEVDVRVAVDGKAVVGLLTLSHRPQLRLAGRIGCIDELVVAASHRGAGIGTQLVEAACVRARELGCVRVDLQTARARESFQRGFYRKRGFRELESALLSRSLRPAG
jgi:GNAT superfamily N-acetyltransferase